MKEIKKQKRMKFLVEGRLKAQIKKNMYTRNSSAMAAAERPLRRGLPSKNAVRTDRFS
ncbi:hypothetical protein [Candidatus Pseudoscillospira sp. SGI.172]|uniref:hypothetical protein n=1 Tax=Candidatus Pseudoscillospira sp. SGI.172 TaxID=3420582 RepID=UPI003D0373C3